MVGWLLLPNTPDGVREHIRSELKRFPSVVSDTVEQLVPLYTGKGLDPESLTACYLVEPTLVEAYLKWRALRTAKSGEHRKLLSMLRGFIHPETGLRAQQVEFAWDFLGWKPADPQTREGSERYVKLTADWLDTCRSWHEDLGDLLRGGKGEKSRNPATSLESIVRHPSPMSIVNTLTDNHAASKPRGSRVPNNQTEAIWHRDQMLLRMFATNPLRNRNYREMTWRKDNTGNLYRGGQGEWRVRFEPSDFKNQKGAAQEKYGVEVPAELAETIESYLHQTRDVLLRTSEATRFSSLGTVIHSPVEASLAA